MARRDIPPQWLPLLERNGIHSARQLAERLDVAPMTATRLLHAESTSPETIQAAADQLRVETAEIRRLRGEVELPPFQLPHEADQLTPRQRAAVLAVVRAMLPTDDLAAQQQEIAALEEDLSKKIAKGRPEARKGKRKVSESAPLVTLSDRRSRNKPSRP